MPYLPRGTLGFLRRDLSNLRQFTSVGRDINTKSISYVERISLTRFSICRREKETDIGEMSLN